jgi:hypothetical protein
MASVTWRLHGRFVYGEAMASDQPADGISAIAPNFDAPDFEFAHY